jgi:hypothetical protein
MSLATATIMDSINSHQSIPGYSYISYKGNGKAISLQAWTGPKGSRRLRLPDF